MCRLEGHARSEPGSASSLNDWNLLTSSCAACCDMSCPATMQYFTIFEVAIAITCLQIKLAFPDVFCASIALSGPGQLYHECLDGSHMADCGEEWRGVEWSVVECRSRWMKLLLCPHFPTLESWQKMVKHTESDPDRTQTVD
jgi:hypothetical protein